MIPRERLLKAMSREGPDKVPRDISWGMSPIAFEKFKENYPINFAVVRALEIIGEATKRLPKTLRNQHPEIPWSDMAGMRDRIIHGYDNVNLKIVWDTVKNRIPILKHHIQQILENYEE